MAKLPDSLQDFTVEQLEEERAVYLGAISKLERAVMIGLSELDRIEKELNRRGRTDR